MKKLIFTMIAIVGMAFADPYHIDITLKGFDRQEALDSTVWDIDTLDNRCILRDEVVAHDNTIWMGSKKIVVTENPYFNHHPRDYYDLVPCGLDNMVWKDRVKLVVQHFVRFKCPENPKSRVYEQHIANLVVAECNLPYKVDWIVRNVPGLFLASRLIGPNEKSWYEHR